MEEYNLLTKNLLAAGFTAENHPDYVYIGKYCRDKEHPLSNLDGGFRYYGWYVYGKTYRTPCGLQCKGTSCMTGLSTGGVDFYFENDMATVKCPYGITDCEKKNALLRNAGVVSSWCNVHMVDEEYQYEGSVEGLLKLEDERIQREKIGFKLMHNGRACDAHMYYDQKKKEWKMEYNPCNCARLKCKGYFGKPREDGVLICPILGRPLDKKSGNVFYDVKTTRRRYDLDGTLFEGQIDTHIEKGVRFLNHPVSMDICRNIVKLCSDEIKQKIILNKYHAELFFAEYHGRVFSVEILNIRAEQRESRDLMQDLEDIRNGIQIIHSSDAAKRNKEDKRQRREEAKQKRIAAIKKKILDTGYCNMELVDQRRADKLLDAEVIDELEAMREENLKKEQEKPEQLSLFDLFDLREGVGE